ncbi:MAG: FtsW/RodA/SpoVE family cell cycle protein [Candidatus Amoebophilus sp.]
MVINRWLKDNLKGDPVIWGITFLLAILSILVVYSAASSLAYRKMQGNTEYYLLKHTSLMLVSLGAMWVAHRIDYRYYAGIARISLWISVPLLLITWRYGIKVNEASRWLTIPIINRAFQPSDLAQLALIVRIASILAKNQAHIADINKVLISILSWCGTICGLIALTNLSGAILLFFICILLMYFGRIPIKYLVILGVSAMFITGLALLVGQRGKTALSRIHAFKQQEIPFQTEQAYIAIATGGLYGKGPGKSTQRNFLPYSYSDFIYAILVEEYGLIGGIAVMLLYLILLYRGIKPIADKAKFYAGLLSAGLSFLISMQALVNMGIAVGLGPVTGLQLPFISMGGTSLMFTGISLGMILSAGRGEIDTSIDALANSNGHVKPTNTYKVLPTKNNEK